jgi:hypothetical protein
LVVKNKIKKTFQKKELQKIFQKNKKFKNATRVWNEKSGHPWGSMM